MCMKKFFTLAVLALLTTVSVNAQSTLRKTWDFRQGFSSKTINALKGDQEEFGADKYWRNYEGDATKADDQHFWNASKSAKNADGYACTHNGGQEKVISELDGLKLGMSNAKKFVITYNGAQAPNEFESEGGPAIGEMIPHGKSYVWLNGKNETIAFSAEVGQTIKIGVESHAVNKTKLGEARGISLSTSTGTLTPKFEGNSVPTYYTEYEWELTGDAGTVAELTIKSTNGCHIYYIIVGEGDDPNANKTQVGYISAGDAASEAAYQTLAADETLNVTAISAESLTEEQLGSYAVSVISPSLPADHAAVSVLKSALPFYPILNLNPQLYNVWGYGQAEKSESEGAFISDLKHDLFVGFDENDYVEDEGRLAVFFAEGNYTGVKLGDYFAGDSVLVVDAFNPELVAVHIHNPYHNGYLYMPFGTTSGAIKMLSNAIAILASSKSEITQVSAPKITLEYKDMKTNISMSMASSNMPKPHIYYTLDGTDPTTESAEYTEPFAVTSETVVKAVAIAEGYKLSEIATATAEIFAQPAAPTIAKTFNEGETIVNITCSSEGVDIWYNYSETNDTTKSMKYAEPLSIKAPVTLTAFAVVNGQVFSELTTERIVVKNAIVRIDQIGAFDANAADWQNGGGSTVYYFSWGKSARSIYNTTVEPIGTEVDPETGDEISVYPELDYEYYVPTTTDGEGQIVVKGDWEVKSKGQVMIWQSLTAGKDAGNWQGYNPATSADIISYAPITNNCVQFGGKTSGEPYTGAIQTRSKYQGPFDVVSIVGNCSGDKNTGIANASGRMMIQVSTDSLTWINIGDEIVTPTGNGAFRLWVTRTSSYNESDEVYVRMIQVGGSSSQQVWNMYILNAGEQSQTVKTQYDAEYADYLTGISTISNKGTNVAKAVYDLNGVRQNGLRRGLNIVVTADGKAKKVMVK